MNKPVDFATQSRKKNYVHEQHSTEKTHGHWSPLS